MLLICAKTHSDIRFAGGGAELCGELQRIQRCSEERRKACDHHERAVTPRRCPHAHAGTPATSFFGHFCSTNMVAQCIGQACMCVTCWCCSSTATKCFWMLLHATLSRSGVLRIVNIPALCCVQSSLRQGKKRVSQHLKAQTWPCQVLV